MTCLLNITMAGSTTQDVGHQFVLHLAMAIVKADVLLVGEPHAPEAVLVGCNRSDF